MVEVLSQEKSTFPDASNVGLGLNEYQQLSARTDRSRAPGDAATSFLLLGLYGEVGSLLSELKKKQRDPNSYLSYESSALEEFGDVLWYFTNLVRHEGMCLSAVAERAAELGEASDQEGVTPKPVAFADLQRQGHLFRGPVSGTKFEQQLLRLAAKVGNLVNTLGIAAHGTNYSPLDDLAMILRALVEAANDADISLELAARLNLEKTLSRWPVERNWGELYDTLFDPDEQLPRNLRMTFREKLVYDKTYVIQQCNGINIGDRLTDNSSRQDDYRFHDVFHLSYAAILGWSPTLRALLRVKRKSDPNIDEQEDGARAILTEEGIANWVFAHASRHQYFEFTSNVDFSLLKSIHQMVGGLEVESRPFWMWEHAILEGFKVFRELKIHRSGTVTADLINRTLSYHKP